MVGKFKNPRCVKCLLVKHKAQKNAWMDSNSLLDWFSHHFIPDLQRYRAEECKAKTGLLLIDNVTSHPPLDQLNTVDENFIVKFLPPLATSLLQPVGQGIVRKLKKAQCKDC